jgi:hypothetical protein
VLDARATAHPFFDQAEPLTSSLSRQLALHWRQPPALTAIKLMQSGPLPSDWSEQRAMLGFT